MVSNEKKKIMILGAGVFQVSAIRKAVDLGYHVLSVDYLPDNIGHTYSHEYINASTVDIDAVLNAAISHQIDGIFTIASDIALPTVAKVASNIGIPGPTQEQVNTLIMKDQFRHFQAANDLDYPAFLEIDDLNQAINSWRGGPTILRPAVSSGSRGISKLEKVDSSCITLFESAREYSFSGKVCLEEYISGTDVTVEGFVIGGNIRYAFITHKHVDGFSVVGHELPGNLNEVTQEQIIAKLQKIITAVNYDSGPFDADIRVNNERAVILEMTPRLGGNAVPILVEKAYGIPLIELSIRHAMGDLPIEKELVAPKHQVPHGVVLLRSDQSGTVVSINTETDMCSRLPEIVDICLNLTPGQKVDRFVHGGNIFGYSIFEMSNNNDYEGLSAQTLDSMGLKLQQVKIH